MASILYKNDLLAKMISKFVEAAKSINALGFSLGRCGSMILDVTSFMPEGSNTKSAISPEYALKKEMPGLKDRFFYVTSYHCSFEQFARTPMDYGAIIRITRSCNGYEAIADHLVKFPKELDIFLSAYSFINDARMNSLCFIHSYPMELELAMRKLNGAADKFLDLAEDFSPDQTWTFKDKFRVVSSTESDFENKISEALCGKNNVFVPKHGLYTFGIDPTAAADKTAAINLAAKFINRL
ncbi:MAG: hypothetical protein IIU03_02770 [Bacteroidales bacterium]|nr:hypothetical protein [Bacteroidales bacterium]MBQ5539144.1 hypothetical protein [Bacteroidales bacterium]